MRRSNEEVKEEEIMVEGTATDEGINEGTNLIPKEEAEKLRHILQRFIDAYKTRNPEEDVYKRQSQGKTHEGIYRRTGGPDRQLHHRRECYGAPDGEKVWDIEEYGTHGSNKLGVVFCMRVCCFVRDILFPYYIIKNRTKKVSWTSFYDYFLGFLLKNALIGRLLLFEYGNIMLGQRNGYVSYTHLDVYKRQVSGCHQPVHGCL